MLLVKITWNFEWRQVFEKALISKFIVSSECLNHNLFTSANRNEKLEAKGENTKYNVEICLASLNTSNWTAMFNDCSFMVLDLSFSISIKKIHTYEMTCWNWTNIVIRPRSLSEHWAMCFMSLEFVFFEQIGLVPGAYRVHRIHGCIWSNLHAAGWCYISDLYFKEVCCEICHMWL